MSDQLQSKNTRSDRGRGPADPELEATIMRGPRPKSGRSEVKRQRSRDGEKYREVIAFAGSENPIMVTGLRLPQGEALVTLRVLNNAMESNTTTYSITIHH